MGLCRDRHKRATQVFNALVDVKVVNLAVRQIDKDSIVVNLLNVHIGVLGFKCLHGNISECCVREKDLSSFTRHFPIQSHENPLSKSPQRGVNIAILYHEIRQNSTKNAFFLRFIQIKIRLVL